MMKYNKAKKKYFKPLEQNAASNLWGYFLDSQMKIHKWPF